NLYIVNPRTDKAKKISAKAFRKSAKAYRISNFRCISAFIMAKKRGENPVFGALSSSLVQRYNIFVRNANRFNISQQPAKC
ncbi:MAG: hypothetical protein MR641_09225, partial [Bacteroidales bacterium]|nr:hypothetical protein [Bacteroidales bacterium]